jgi:hypothetical protein
MDQPEAPSLETVDLRLFPNRVSDVDVHRDEAANGEPAEDGPAQRPCHDGAGRLDAPPGDNLLVLQRREHIAARALCLAAGDPRDEDRFGSKPPRRKHMSRDRRSRCDQGAEFTAAGFVSAERKTRSAA